MAHGDLWETSPAAMLLLERNAIKRLNAASARLLGVKEPGELGRWPWSRLDERGLRKFEGFLSDPAKSSLALEIFNPSGDKVYLRFQKSILDSHTTVLCVEDLTEVREDVQALQAGYDEFIRVTTDLEKALITIEKQNMLLEKQASILQNEMRIAHAVQAQVFAQNFDHIKTVHAAGSYQAMTDLGGDMWAFHENDGEFLAVIGDVMGHGVASSLISIAARTLFKKKFEEQDIRRTSLADLTSTISSEIMDVTRGNSFVTACILRVDKEHILEYVTAGHPPIFLVRAGVDGEGEQLATEQPMLGIFQNVHYLSQSVTVKPGDRLLMFTDCLLESFNPAGEPLSLERVSSAMRKTGGRTVKDALQSVLDYRQEHALTDVLPDDLAVVCIEIPEPSETAGNPPAAHPKVGTADAG